MKKLTKEEKKWVEELQSVLDKCPSDRMSSFTIGDSEVTIYDNTYDTDIYNYLDEYDNKDFCHGVQKFNCELATLYFPFDVQSTAG